MAVDGPGRGRARGCARDSRGGRGVGSGRPLIFDKKPHHCSHCGHNNHVSEQC